MHQCTAPAARALLPAGALRQLSGLFQQFFPLLYVGTLRIPTHFSCDPCTLQQGLGTICGCAASCIPARSLDYECLNGHARPGRRRGTDTSSLYLVSFSPSDLACYDESGWLLRRLACRRAYSCTDRNNCYSFLLCVVVDFMQSTG